VGQKPLSKTSQRRVDGITAALGGIKTTLAKIDESQIADLIRRSAIPIGRDGYPSTSMPEHSSGGSTSDPTGRTAAAGADKDRQPNDTIGRAAKNLEREIKKAEKSLLDAAGILENELRNLSKKKERPSSVPCSICLTNAADRAGWCTPDYNDWWRHGSPDRAIWEMWSRKDADENGVLRVPECPKPSSENKAIRGPWRNSDFEIK